MANFDKKEINQSFSVLYVEDEASVREVMLEILTIFVDDIFVAHNGEEGLKSYHEYLPDMIITDIQMPVMTGLDMMREIRKSDEDIPVIVTSAFNVSTYLLEAIGLGIEHYLLKPVKMDSLEAKLERVKKQIMQQRELDAYQLYLEERVQQEIILREAQEALILRRNKDIELGQMVSIIAHQWKQPLHYLHLLIEDLGYEYQENGVTQEFMDSFVRKGVERVDFLSETMDNFLRFYKSDYKLKTFNVTDVVNDIVLFISALYKAVGISLELKVINDFSLHGSDNEFQQVILNLLNNAKEAFDGLKKNDAKVLITIEGTEKESVVEISDNAGGIAENILENIFLMEYTTKSHGNGLGLYLVEKIVTQRFAGKMSVKNRDGGACFRLSFSEEKGL